MMLLLALVGCKSGKKVADDPIYGDYTPQKTETKKPSGDKAKKVGKTWKDYDIRVERGDNKSLYQELEDWLGVPYVYGGHDKNGTDCSGLVMEVFLKVYGKKVARNSERLYIEDCDEIEKESVKEGDLVFFCTGTKAKINHVGIYLKDDKFVHAGTNGVVVSGLSEPYYVDHFVVAGRVKK